ncbi:lipase [Enterovibrio sp. ZSDZ35]|uniref:Lipase n=1 Tax=Enterovibrio qingdaonensis TaxID=2899818 RepID=A0ABT5QLD4_9GAMM|nr:VolA/Pla-1 family phospholipase [Enterovibrio sp. ZSDZ35]MDD1781305.1 lipase [Enterovibrio sp. ZSDZ35]
MKTKILAMMVSAALLSACNDSSLSGEPTLDPGVTDSLNAPTKVNFDLLAKKPVVVTPSFIAVDTHDGTLASEGTVGSSAYSTDISDPLVATGKTDGWGTQSPISVSFTGNDLDPSTASQGFRLMASINPTASSSTVTPTLLKENQDYSVSASGKTLTVSLKKPLNPAAEYMFAITNDLKDVTGASVGMTRSYALLKDKAAPPSDALKPAQAITRTVESEFNKAGVPAEDIIFSTWFTTASAGDVLYGAKQATAFAIDQGASSVWKGSAISSSVTSAELDALFSITAQAVTPTQTSAGNTVIALSVKLPYFLSKEAGTFSSTPWKSGMPSLAAITNILSSGTTDDKAAVLSQLTALGISQSQLATVATDPQTQADVLPKLVGATLTKADGSQLDAERLVTRYSPVPMLRSVEDVPVMLVVPKSANCANGAKMRAVIFQHGITSKKETLTDNGGIGADGLIGDNCVAIFAIDHPLHGERAISEQLSATTGSAAVYLNLAALPVARDNLRQSAIDVINLRASIGRILALLKQGGTLAAPLGNLDPDKGVAFVGHSLGAITGVDVGNVANRSVNNPTADTFLFNINAVALANPGAGIPYLLLNSGFFGDFVKGSLLAGANQTFAGFCQQNGLSNDLKTCFSVFQTNSPDAALQPAYDAFGQYAVAAQIVLDSVDPINHAGSIGSNIPVYMSSVAGDETIPNALKENTPIRANSTVYEIYSPSGGTLPLIEPLDLDATTASVSGQTVKSALLFTEGGHSSLLNTSPSGNANTEMLDQIASFINGDGKTLVVGDSSILSTSQ